MKTWKILMLLMALLGISGCDQKTIDKQDADNIVTQYIKKNFKSDDRTERAAWYYNSLEEDRIELSFTQVGEESIIAENAFVYYIDEHFPLGNKFPHPHRIILVQKENGKYTVYQRSISPYVSPVNDWKLLYMFANGQFWY